MAWHDTVFALTARCTQKPARCEHRSRLLLEIRASILPKYEFDPICGIQELMKIDLKLKNYCESCVVAMKQMLEKKQEDIWADLDAWIGLNVECDEE